jgi:hypothetical protein
MALVVSPLATVTVGRFGTQLTLSIGIIFEFAGLFGASWATEIWHLFLSQGLAFGFGMGFLFVASVGVVPQVSYTSFIPTYNITHRAPLTHFIIVVF